MNCPKCKEDMQIKTILNVEIDICPACKGIWLDEGELSKLAGIDPSANSFAQALYNVYNELKEEAE
ncbi:MAG: zf-TFIIB domain-containing protein [Thermoplasmata archaeon]|nr:MAG: zf-TFIIB domain-containing protein [Thermoplasmata archaeon]